jgi:electron transport complex protein RnfE
MDGIGMGIGFTLALLLISGIRELLGTGKLFGYNVFNNFEPILVIGMPSGALLVIGLLLGFFNLLKEKKE